MEYFVSDFFAKKITNNCLKIRTIAKLYRNIPVDICTMHRWYSVLFASLCRQMIGVIISIKRREITP